MLAAQKMKDKWGASLEAVFVHDVSKQPNRKELRPDDPNRPENFGEENMEFLF